jgi:hypothetical protein
MIYKGVLCILLCWFCLSSIKLFQPYNSQPIPYATVRWGWLSIKRTRDVVYINTRYMFTLATFLVQTGYLAENKVLPKKESRTVRLRFVEAKVACCNISYTTFNVCMDIFFRILHPLRTASDEIHILEITVMIMTQRQYNITWCSILQKDMQSSQERGKHPLLSHT